MIRESLLLFAVFASSSVLANAEKQQIGEISPRLYDPVIRKIALFESGTAFVDREIEADMLGVGTFWMKAPFNPIYGTLYVNAPRALALTSKIVKIEVPNIMPLNNPAESFANREVTVFLRDEARSVVNGTMLPALLDKDGNVVNNCIRIKDNTTGKISYIQAGWILRVDATDCANETLEKTPVLEFKKSAKLPSGSTFGYLTNGISWSPDYQLQLTKDYMSIEMAATVSNKLEDLKDVEAYFVLGTPSVDHQNQLSLMAFGNLYNPRPLRASASARASSTMMENNDAFVGASRMKMDNIAPQTQSSTGDVIYLTGGKITLDKGDSRRISLAYKDNVPYERIVDLEVFSRRDNYGRTINENKTDCFDAIRLVNPLNIPISASAVSIYDDGRFIGESQAKWCNPKESTTIRIAKAQSIAVDLKTIENVDSRKEEVTFYGNRYYRVDAEAVVKLHSFRAEDAKVQLKYNLTGKILDAPDGKIETQQSSYYGINPQNLISYDITLPANSEKEIKIKYQAYIGY